MAIENPRTKQLQRLASQLPIANQRIAQGLDQARIIQMQQAVGGAPATVTNARPLAQAVGAEQAKQAGAIALQTAQNVQQQSQAVGQLGLAEQRRAADQALFQKQLGVQQKSRDLANQLAGLDQSLKNKLLDEELSFSRDEMGRILFNERQLADFRLSTAKGDEELRAYEQQVSQMSERRLKMLQVSQAKIKQTLQQGFTESEQELDQASKQRLAIALNQIKEKIAREKARQANRAAMFQAVGTIGGAVAGAVLTNGSPAGAAVGASVGGALGGVAAANTAEEA
jgi:hypothetical protein